VSRGICISWMVAEAVTWWSTWLPPLPRQAEEHPRTVFAVASPAASPAAAAEAASRTQFNRQ
jgi:hypothetical protein